MESLTHYILLYGYAGMFVVIFLESSIVFPLPGDSLLFTAGIFAAQGKFGLTLPMLLAVFCVATFLGSIAGYYIGVHAIRLRHFAVFRKLLAEEHLDKVHAFFQKYGKQAMLISRFVPIVRTFTPVAAGMGRMDFAEFVKYNILGSILWSFLVTSLGFYLGRVFPGINHYLSYVVVLVVIISVAPAFVHRYMNKKAAAGKDNDK